MVKIIPFKGIRYNPEKIKAIEEVVTPPYDVISDDERDMYYERHENNAVRLILGREYAGDDSKNNKYTRAREYFEIWRGEGVLTRDKEPSLYVYEQEYIFKDEKRIMRGFIALAKLEEFEKGVILPHEKTLSSPIKDRLRLMRGCRVNFSPIFSIYADPENIVEDSLEAATEQAPVISFKDEQGIWHRLWKASEFDSIKRVTEAMKDKTVVIADGHHRYMTSLEFRDEMRKITGKNSGNEPFDYTMMFFVNVEGNDVTILPAHRLVRNMREFDISKIFGNIREYFTVETFEFDDENEVEQRMKLFAEMKKRNNLEHAFGMYCKGKKYYLLSLKGERMLDEIIKVERSKLWKRLDVTITHALILTHIVGMEEGEDDLKYVIDEEEAVRMVKDGEYQLAIFLNPTKITQVMEVAMAREKMPGKATYFYPKPLTGLVMNEMT